MGGSKGAVPLSAMISVYAEKLSFINLEWLAPATLRIERSGHDSYALERWQKKWESGILHWPFPTWSETILGSRDLKVMTPNLTQPTWRISGCNGLEIV